MVKLTKLKIRVNHCGEKFERLLTIEYAGSRVQQQKNNRVSTKQYYKCLCDCGEIVIVDYQSLKNKKTKTCGICPSIKGSKHGHWQGYGEISKDLFNSYKHSAKDRKIPFNVSIEYLWNLFLRQGKKCALTGWNIHFPPSYKERKNKTASPDRIDNSKGYIEGNIQWVHRDVNYMKLNLDNDYFIKVCKAISANHC